MGSLAPVIGMLWVSGLSGRAGALPVRRGASRGLRRLS